MLTFHSSIDFSALCFSNFPNVNHSCPYFDSHFSFSLFLCSPAALFRISLSPLIAKPAKSENLKLPNYKPENQTRAAPVVVCLPCGAFFPALAVLTRPAHIARATPLSRSAFSMACTLNKNCEPFLPVFGKHIPAEGALTKKHKKKGRRNLL